MTRHLAHPPRLDLDSFACRCDIHPDLIRRLVALDLIEAERDTGGTLWFTPAQLADVARIQRLRSAFALNYASLGLVCDLLDRVASLESDMRHHSRLPQERTA